MRIARCHALAWTLLTALTLFAATDKLKNAMQDLGSDDPAAARKSRAVSEQATHRGATIPD